MPSQLREWIAEPNRHASMDRGSKDSHHNFTHPGVTQPVTLSGNPGDDTKKYQEIAVKVAIAEATK